MPKRKIKAIAFLLALICFASAQTFAIQQVMQPAYVYLFDMNRNWAFWSTVAGAFACAFSPLVPVCAVVFAG